ncbi:acyl-CoA dehydrogenase family protein, partial [Streptomyces sp. NPDC005373]|uniref:acyl-CoA dehydrogenase family protein n=1 Tax=Streptomyces sp. NPDC005373 TaxID=3156879 RepID=UPI0033B16FC9
MDFLPSVDQSALAGAVHDFCTHEVGEGRIRALADVDGFDPALWRGLAEMGLFGLRTPERDGGLGLGLAEAVLVFTELGRALVPGPLVASHLAATAIPGGTADGEIVGLVEVGDGAGPVLVEHFTQLRRLIVVTDESVLDVAPSAVRVTEVPQPLDPLTPLHQLHGQPSGVAIGDGRLARDLRREGAALTAALQLGIAEAALERTSRYAVEREQFGRVIGSFQAVKHMLADMQARVEVAGAAVHAAAVTLDDPQVGSVDKAVSTAKLIADEPDGVVAVPLDPMPVRHLYALWRTGASRRPA